MSYLFSNPQVKKWKTLFCLSFLLNIILAAAITVSDNNGQIEDGEKDVETAVDNSDSDNIPVAVEENSAVSEKSLKNEKRIIAGDPLYSFVIIEENFFSAFSQSKEVSSMAEATGIESLSNLLSAHIGRLLMWDLVLRTDVRKNDRIDFVFRVVPDEEKKRRKDMPDLIEIVSVVYHSKKFNKDISIFQFKPSSSEYYRYYYRSGVNIEKIIGPYSPVKNYIQVTSLLADRAPKHDGVDFKANVGTPVHSTVEGTVSRKNWMTKYNGFCVELEEKGKPFVYKYLHLSEVLVDVGQKVSPGQHIANSGNTGKTTAPHLHYQINIGQRGDVIDPFRHHKANIEKLDGKDLDAFKSKVIDIEKLMH